MASKRKKGDTPEWRKHVEYTQRGSNGYWKCLCSPLCEKATKEVCGGVATWTEHMLGPVPGAKKQVRVTLFYMCAAKAGVLVYFAGFMPLLVLNRAGCLLFCRLMSACTRPTPRKPVRKQCELQRRRKPLRRHVFAPCRRVAFAAAREQMSEQAVYCRPRRTCAKTRQHTMTCCLSFAQLRLEQAAKQGGQRQINFDAHLKKDLAKDAVRDAIARYIFADAVSFSTIEEPTFRCGSHNKFCCAGSYNCILCSCSARCAAPLSVGVFFLHYIFFQAGHCYRGGVWSSARRGCGACTGQEGRASAGLQAAAAFPGGPAVPSKHKRSHSR